MFTASINRNAKETTDTEMESKVGWNDVRIGCIVITLLQNIK